MIHYTLLPEGEMKKLRREYRLRLIIIILFFVSCGLVFGILALLPSYILSHAQYTEALNGEKELQKSRTASGAVQIEKDLAQVQTIARNIIADKDAAVYSDMIENIITRTTSAITLNSFELSHAAGTTTPVGIIIQGKATTREGLVSFKKSLEASKLFSAVELPVSDLAKSKDISFAVRLTLERQK